MLEENNVRQGSFERPEFEAVLANLPAELKPVFEVAYITGWRLKSEILSRQKNHLDLESGWLRLERGETKNRKGRMFPLLPELRAVLQPVVVATRKFEEKPTRGAVALPPGGRANPIVPARMDRRYAIVDETMLWERG